MDEGDKTQSTKSNHKSKSLPPWATLNGLKFSM